MPRGNATVSCMRYCSVPRHLYVHVPFCARRCSYCNFSIAVRRDVPVNEYLSALDTELRLRVGASDGGELDTLYFGGGTPSRLGGDGLARAVSVVRRYFTLAPGAEITAEANPDDVTLESASAWAAAGINRLSIGSQSFDARALGWMHRTHDGDAIGRAVADARHAGITNLSLDLIFALPNALERDFRDDIERLLVLTPQHVSLYGLTVEAQTPLARWVRDGITVEQPEEGYETDFLLAHDLLTVAGFEHYEVSNYGLPGSHARHNASYWAGVPYLGVGPAAHGFDGETRRWNTRAYIAWRDQLASGIDPREGDEQLTPANRLAEAVYLGLRTSAGLEMHTGDTPLVAPWRDAGWVTIAVDGRLRCTALGWLRLDSLAAGLTHHRSR